MRAVILPVRSNPLLLSLSAMIIISVLVGLVGQGNGEPPARPSAEIIDALAIGFRDSPDGTVIVTLADTDQELAVFQSGEGFFLRGAVRTLVHERKIRNIQSRSSFELEKLNTGSLLLSDPMTGYWIALDAFGRDNVKVFQDLLDKSKKRHYFNIVVSD